ncbi:MAG: hypothetical protein QM523_00940 [Candidatus Pacebacteria bacterium]|nr:hypothetical protein [Candidatus Paceibacterota bacterium]
MTEAQAAWLRKLRDEGPRRPWHHEWEHMRRTWEAGFCEFGPHGKERTEPLSCMPDIPWLAAITPAGLAALSAYDEKGK